MALFDRNELHRKKIMKQLYFGQSLSLAELSEGIDKSIPLTTRILNEMVEEGTVVESGLAPSTGGRRPAMYSIRQDVLFMVSVSMDQFVTRITIMDLHNRSVTPIEKINLTLPQNPAYRCRRRRSFRGRCLIFLCVPLRPLLTGKGIPGFGEG